MQGISGSHRANTFTGIVQTLDTQKSDGSQHILSSENYHTDEGDRQCDMVILSEHARNAAGKVEEHQNVSLNCTDGTHLQEKY